MENEENFTILINIAQLHWILSASKMNFWILVLECYNFSLFWGVFFVREAHLKYGHGKGFCNHNKKKNIKQI